VTTFAPIAASRRRLSHAHVDGFDAALTVAMLTMTFSTGVVDAASYLGLHRVFTANMTGNVVFIGLGLGGGSSAGIPVLRSALAFGGFLVGAALAGRAQRRAPRDVRAARSTIILFGVVAGLLAVLAVWFGISTPTGSTLNVLIVVFGGAMGSQAGAARRIGVTDVSTVVITSTAAALAGESWFGSGRANGKTPRRLTAVLAMGIGAFVGAMLLRIQIAVPLGLASGISAAVTVWLIAVARSPHNRLPTAG
jgi:uncharacterized membrane protein YoaK (UPF0700 family)